MICSNKNELQENLSKLKDKFIQVHYPENIIQEQFLRIEKVNRKDLIFKQIKPKTSKNKAKKRFIFLLTIKKIHHTLDGLEN